MRVRYTLPASADLDGVLGYLTARSPRGARRVKESIKATERMLIQFPLVGQPTRLTWLRRIVTGPYPYVIFYEVSGDEVVIHAVRHGARQPSSMPDQE